MRRTPWPMPTFGPDYKKGIMKRHGSWRRQNADQVRRLAGLDLTGELEPSHLQKKASFATSGGNSAQNETKS